MFCHQKISYEQLFWHIQLYVYGNATVRSTQYEWSLSPIRMVVCDFIINEKTVYHR